MTALRRYASLRFLSALLFGTLTATATVVTTGTIVGCADENTPEGQVELLQDPIRRPAAVTRLLQYYEDAMTKDKKNREGENVKPILDLVVPPLAKLAESGELEQRQQGTLLAFLADVRDERALPALAKAIKDYRPDDRRPEDYDKDMVEVVRNVGEMAKAGKMKSPDVNAALLELFDKLQASTPKAQNKAFFRVLNHTMVQVADPAWEARLIGKLNAEIKSNDPKNEKQVMNEVYWQITSAEILGKLRSQKAIRPLMKIVLTPFKGKIATTAINALIKIGKPAIAEGVKVLKGEDEEMLQYAEAEHLRGVKDRGEKEDKAAQDAAKIAYLNQAAVMVAFMGREDCLPPMLEAIEKGSKATKAIIARELYKLPASAEATAAFTTVYRATDNNVKLPSGDYAKEQLVESAGSFFDKDLNAFMVSDAIELKGEESDITSVRAIVLGVAAKAATKDQWENVEKLLALLPKVKSGNKNYFIKDGKDPKEQGPFSEGQIVEKILNLELKQGTWREQAQDETKLNPKEKDAQHQPFADNDTFRSGLEQALYVSAVRNGKKVLDECGDNLDCYAKKLVSPEAQAAETQMVGLKSAYMLALIGGEASKPKFIEALPGVKNQALRYIVALAIDRLSPKGDAAAVKKMQEIVDKAEETRDQSKIDEVKMLNQFIYRLEARAG